MDQTRKANKVKQRVQKAYVAKQTEEAHNILEGIKKQIVQEKKNFQWKKKLIFESFLNNLKSYEMSDLLTNMQVFSAKLEALVNAMRYKEALDLKEQCGQLADDLSLESRRLIAYCHRKLHHYVQAEADYKYLLKVASEDDIRDYYIKWQKKMEKKLGPSDTGAATSSDSGVTSSSASCGGSGGGDSSALTSNVTEELRGKEKRRAEAVNKIIPKFEAAKEHADEEKKKFRERIKEICVNRLPKFDIFGELGLRIPSIFWSKFKILVLAGRYEDADLTVQNVTKRIIPESVEDEMMLAYCHRKLKKYKSALESYELLLGLGLSDGNHYYCMKWKKKLTAKLASDGEKKDDCCAQDSKAPVRCICNDLRKYVTGLSLI